VKRSLGALGLAVVVLARLPAEAPPSGGSSSHPSGSFERLGIPVRVGGLMGCVVGPNGRGGEALYFNFNQISGKLFLVQVDPDTGDARQFNAPEGPGAWALIAGPDEKIYLGTWDGALILRFDPKQPEKGIEVVGNRHHRVLSLAVRRRQGRQALRLHLSASEARQLRSRDRRDGGPRSHASDGNVRRAASRSARPARCTWASAPRRAIWSCSIQGRRSIAASIPPGLRGVAGWKTVGVSRRSDGNVYAEFGANLMRLDDETVTSVSAAPERPQMKLQDGRVVTSFDRGRFSLLDPKTGRSVERTFRYASNGDHIFVVGLGPSGCVLRQHRHAPRGVPLRSGGERERTSGHMPGGEVYSMLEHERKLYLCYYGGAVMNLYDPAKPFWKFGAGADCNPVSFGGVGDGHLRPRAMIYGPGGLIFVGSEPPYGELGGAIGVWDPKLNRTIENYRHLIKNQSIVSLAWEPKSGLIFGGSGNYGGGGTRAVEKEALFFAFDPRKREKVFEAALSSGARNYPATFAAEGKVFTTVGDHLFVFDPQAMR